MAKGIWLLGGDMFGKEKEFDEVRFEVDFVVNWVGSKQQEVIGKVEIAWREVDYKGDTLGVWCQSTWSEATITNALDKT